MTDDCLHNIHVIHTRINRACTKAHRNPKEIKLLMATKTVPAHRIKIALQAGEHIIGENKVQELKEKYDDLKNIPHQSHFIGHLQSNKIKDLLKCNISCIQSIDRYDLAEKLHKRLEYEEKKMDILIQVNTSAEESKFGVAPNRALELVKNVSLLSTLHIKGLMTIGLFSAEEDKVRPCFRKLKKLQQEIIAENLSGVDMGILSMGMSHDLEIAIEEGATMVRVGTAIFGERIYPDSYYWKE